MAATKNSAKGAKAGAKPTGPTAAPKSKKGAGGKTIEAAPPAVMMLWLDLTGLAEPMKQQVRAQVEAFAAQIEAEHVRCAIARTPYPPPPPE